ncbi:TonB-dependent receptor plug domain-containing protein [Flagellimonas beolgyonensis]|uniref:TonB-dependent receptor plug domain-containing protein n=1 Tax=Flagellimonas beolgyonensis TaxID=864064 RepID=UPI003D648AF3
MKKNHLWLIAAIVAGKGLFAQNQQQDTLKVHQLHEVVVSDSKFELKRENSGKTVIKITSEELERNQGRTVAEVINAKSGIEITGSRGRDGDVLGVYARGGRGRQVLILIDGVRVSDPSTFSQEYDMRLLSPTNIASIEIIKGAASTLYGTNAATAVINITTKKSSDKGIAGRFQTSVGTNQTTADQNYNLGSISNAVNVNGTLDRFSYAVDFSNRYKSGLSAAVTPDNEEDIFSHFSTNVRLGYQFSDALEVAVYGNQTKFSNEYDASYADAANLGKNQQDRAGVAANFSYGKGSVHLNAAYSEYKTQSKDTFGESETEGNNWVLDVYNKYVFGKQWHTVLGVNFIKDEAVFSEMAEFTILDPYANVVYISDFGLNLNVGGRLNHHSEYGNHLVYSVNPSYVFTTEKGYLKVFGSYATSYITPNLTQLFGAFGGNPNLEPEENRTIEGGLELKPNGKLRLSTVYFNRNEKNTIGYDANFTSINLSDEINAHGLEVELGWLPVDNLQIDANYTFTERKGDNAIRIPKHKANLTIGYQWEQTQFTLGYAYTGSRLDTNFMTFSNETLEAFSLVSLTIGHELIPNRLRVFLNVENLLNEEFTEVIGFTTRGRNFRAGMNLNF